ncbi:MAG: PAS domain-containing protein [Nitrospira sp.]|nr:PAS domain-containing protein [Nitrospira sp.]
MRTTPLVWVSLGLVSLTISVMLAGDFLIDLVPSRDRQVFDYRRNVAESLAVQYSSLAQRNQLETIKFAMENFAERNQDILSLALLRKNGTAVAQVGDHARMWEQPPGEESTLEFLQVPIFSGEQPWGTLQIAFRQADPSGASWLLTDPRVRFLAFVSVMGFVGYLVFMKRTLRQLDPSGVVPARVKAALDALTQGVVMIDDRNFIVLANEAFCSAVGKPVTSLIGADLDTMLWRFDEPAGMISVYPWFQAVKEKQSQEGVSLLLDSPQGGLRKFIVNAVPIIDGNSVKGVLVSFHDVTELDRINSELKEANSELEWSRTQILEKNQALEKTNSSLSVEINERKKVEAEKEQLYQRLMVASRQAGMADVASNVLHNVGNVLNSINVSTDTLLKTLRKPMVGDVCRIASLFREHQSDLKEFLTVDPQGKQIPGYLSLVADSLSGSHQTIQGELESLVNKLEHVKQVVLSQQDIAQTGCIRESSRMVDLMEQALLMALPEPEKYRVRVSREYGFVPLIMTDRHQVLQILVNLIANAKDAMATQPAATHQLSVRVGMAGDGTNSVRLEVADSGCGIPSEHLPRLFMQGFTTKQHGHGLGLHSAAISAKNMGGSIQASSPGVGGGATFTLSLPVVLADVAA